MKKKLTFIAVFLLVIAGFSACKKDAVDGKPLKIRMIGKWQVTKIETTVGTGATTTYTGVAADYFDFRNNESDEVEVNLANNRNTGNYAVLINQSFNLNVSGELVFCTVTAVNDNLLEFTGTVDKASVTTTRKYYLKR